MTTPETTPPTTPGWHPDPLGQPGWRYHDGTRWTGWRTRPATLAALGLGLLSVTTGLGLDWWSFQGDGGSISDVRDFLGAG